MGHRSVKIAVAVAVCVACLAPAQNTQPQEPTLNGGDFSTAMSPPTKVPTDVILVKGAWSSASDSVTPIPEETRIRDGALDSRYFGLRYTLPPGWTKGYEGPPPSDSGRYVVAQLRASDPHAAARGSILITAQDMFFTPLPSRNALELITYLKDHLQEAYKQEEPPTATKIAGHPFMFFAYWSPFAQLHWYVVATQIRCHAIEVVLTSRDTKLLGSLLLDLEKMTLPPEAGPTAGAGGGDFPVCVKDYASGGNLINKVDPIFTEHRANPVPVRIIIDKSGRVKHIHLLSAFPDQARAVMDALWQWKFKPRMENGHAVEVETGIMFGGGSAWPTTRGSSVE